jgi:hypothetical protein
MRIQVYLLSAAVALIGGAASAKQSCNSADTAAALPGPTAAAESAGAKGRTAAACGQNWSAANLLERETARHPSVQARFNLAAAYTRTDRLEEAAKLYGTVARDGQFTFMVTDPDFSNPNARGFRFNAADEARRRRVEIQRIITARSAFASTSPASASEAAVDVSATVGSETSSAVMNVIQDAHISDSQALAHDQAG